MLLCRPCCLGPAMFRWPSPHARWVSFRVCHLSLCSTPFVFAGLNVLADPPLPISLSSYPGRWSPDWEASKSGNLSLGLEEDDRRRSTLGELIVRVKLMRGCGLTLDYAYELYGSVCISTETKASSYCMLCCKYRGVFRARKHIVVVRKGGCRFAPSTYSALRERALTRPIRFRWYMNVRTCALCEARNGQEE